MDVSIRLDGVDEVRDTLADLSAFMDHPADEAVLAQVARQASARAPRRSGRLAASLRATETAVESPLVYAGVIHNGWARHGIEPHPFVLEAWDEVGARLVDEAAQKLIDRRG